MKLSREELMMEEVNSWSKRQKWLPRIYLIALLALVVVPAVAMNYSEGLSEQLPMCIGFSLVLMTMSLNYGFWLTFAYTFVEGRDGKTSQDILDSVCYMPFSIEMWSDGVKRIVIKKMKLVGRSTFLILAAGMFVGPYPDDRLGIGFYLPENVFQSLAVCIVGTLWVMVYIYVGSVIMKTTVIKRYWKKRTGGKTKKNKTGDRTGKAAISNKAKGTVPKNKKIGKIVSEILGIAIVLWMFFKGIPEITQRYYDYLYDDKTIYLITTGGFVYGVWMFVIFGVVWLFSPYAFESLPEMEDENNRLIKPHMSADGKIGVAVGGVCVAIILSVLNMSWHECFTLDGVEVHHLMSTKEYGWEEVEYYTLEPEDEVMCLELHMMDGKQYNCTGSDFQVVYYSEGFDEEYQEDDWNYCVWLAKTLQEKGIPLKIDSWEQLEDELSVDTQKIQVEKMKDALGVTE